MAKLANALFLGWLFCGVLAADNAGRILSLQEGCELPGVKCHGLPGSCTKGSEVACEMMAKVSPTTNNTVHVQLEARANQTNLHLDMTSHWIAVGFSKVSMEFTTNFRIWLYVCKTEKWTLAFSQHTPLFL